MLFLFYAMKVNNAKWSENGEGLSLFKKTGKKQG